MIISEFLFRVNFRAFTDKPRANLPCRILRKTDGSEKERESITKCPRPIRHRKKTRMRTIPKRNSQILPHGPARENGMLLRNITERPAVPDITENRRTTRIRIPPEQKTLLPETCPKPCLTTDKPKKPSARPSRKTETYAKNSRARSANERARTAYFKSLFYINLRISE